MRPVQHTALVVPLVAPPYFDDVAGLQRDFGGDINIVSDKNGVVVPADDQKTLVLVASGIVGKLFLDSNGGGHPNIGLFCHDNIIKARQRSLCCARWCGGGFGPSLIEPGSLSDDGDAWGIIGSGMLSRRGSSGGGSVGSRGETRPQEGDYG